MRLRTLALLLLASAPVAHAQRLQAVRPLPGYACMMLNLSPAQMQDDSVNVPIYAQPSASSPKVGNAAAVVIATSPLNVVHGFGEVLFPNGRQGWIEAKMLRPYANASNPNAHCTPSLMSNGRPGFG
jgi:hypothetical protein